MSHFFEPTPKRLEIRLTPGTRAHFLKKGVDLWQQIIRSAGAHIVTQHVDRENLVCLLSESTAWITPERALLVTCGRTRLARAATAIAEVFEASSWASLHFSRVTEFRPEEQLSTFDQDVSSLKALVPGASTKTESQALTYRAFRWASGELPPLPYELFLRATHPSLESEADAISIWSRKMLCELPRMTFQEHHFEPTGYSMNAWGDDSYLLIHASPSSPHRFAHVEASPSLRAYLPKIQGELEGFFRPRDVTCVGVHS